MANDYYIDKYDVEWDFNLNCYCLHYSGEIICLSGKSYHTAGCEADAIVADWGN